MTPCPIMPIVLSNSLLSDLPNRFFDRFKSFTTSLVNFGQARSAASTRVYARSGMIPKYTGYLPRKFVDNKI